MCEKGGSICGPFLNLSLKEKKERSRIVQDLEEQIALIMQDPNVFKNFNSFLK